MTLLEAIQVRHSVRQYLDKPVEAEKIAQLRAFIDECNRKGGLHMQLVTDEPKAFSEGMAKYGKFSGISNYIAMVCKKGDDTTLGYYGEQVVLLVQTLGLNTCWVGLTFSKQPDKFEVQKGEHLVCLVPVGYGATQGVQHPQKKTIDDVAEGALFPEWFVRGIEAALLAPTAVNQQLFRFILHDGNKVEAKKTFSLTNGMGYAPIDLGIVKYHFEIGAGKENFEWI